MKNKDLFTLQQGLRAVAGLKGVKFAYAAARNQKIVQDEIEALQKANVDSPEFLAYQQVRVQLCEQHAVKDENGKPKVKPGGREYDILDMPAFEAALTALNKEHQAAFDGKLKQEKEYGVLLGEEVRESFQLHFIPLSVVPEDITKAQMDGILLMIVGE